MPTQHSLAVYEERRADTDRGRAHKVRGRGVVDDPDPHAHLTAAERYARAIQRRDALVTANRACSQDGSQRDG